MPQTNSSTEEAITSQSSTLPVAFRSVFLPISSITGFFHAKCVSKRSPTAFLVVVTLCSITLKALGCFLFVFATTVANTSSARARTKKSTQKCQKSRFCDFCTKNRTFFTENRCKSTHWAATKENKPYQTILRRKSCIFKLFANHEPFERHFWSQGVHFHHAFSPHLDQIETRGLDH